MQEAIQAETEAREARDALQKLYDEALVEVSSLVTGFNDTSDRLPGSESQGEDQETQSAEKRSTGTVLSAV